MVTCLGHCFGHFNLIVRRQKQMTCCDLRVPIFEVITAIVLVARVPV